MSEYVLPTSTKTAKNTLFISKVLYLFFGFLFVKSAEFCGEPAVPSHAEPLLASGHIFGENPLGYPNGTAIQYRCLDVSDLLVGEGHRQCLDGRWTGRPPRCALKWLALDSVRLVNVTVKGQPKTNDVTVAPRTDQSDFLFSPLPPGQCFRFPNLTGNQTWTFRLNSAFFIDILAVVVLATKATLSSDFDLTTSVGRYRKCRKYRLRRHRLLATYLFECRIENSVNFGLAKSDSIEVGFKADGAKVSICGLQLYRFNPDCGLPDIGRFAIVTFESPFHFFHCETGYHLEGNQRVRCDVSGQWTEEFPYCRQKKQCPFHDLSKKDSSRALRNVDSRRIPRNVGSSRVPRNVSPSKNKKSVGPKNRVENGREKKVPRKQTQKSISLRKDRNIILDPRNMAQTIQASIEPMSLPQNSGNDTDSTLAVKYTKLINVDGNQVALSGSVAIFECALEDSANSSRLKPEAEVVGHQFIQACVNGQWIGPAIPDCVGGMALVSQQQVALGTPGARGDPTENMTNLMKRFLAKNLNKTVDQENQSTQGHAWDHAPGDPMSPVIIVMGVLLSICVLVILGFLVYLRFGKHRAPCVAQRLRMSVAEVTDMRSRNDQRQTQMTLSGSNYYATLSVVSESTERHHYESVTSSRISSIFGPWNGSLPPLPEMHGTTSGDASDRLEVPISPTKSSKFNVNPIYETT